MKTIAILFSSVFLYACGGGENGNENAGTTESVDHNIQNILGGWYLPEGCTNGIETAKIDISMSTNSSERYVISFTYFNENNGYFYYHYQSIFDIQVVRSSTAADGSISYYLLPGSVSNSSGQNDLFITQYTESFRLSNGGLQVANLCSTMNESLFVRGGAYLEETVKARLLIESSATRNYYKSIFDDNWAAVQTDYAIRGMIGSLGFCNSRLGVVSDYLDLLLADISSNDSKYVVFDSGITSGWSNQIYQELYNLDMQELPYPVQYNYCSSDAIVNEINVSYTSGINSIL